MRAIGIILAGGASNRMTELTTKRATSALPIAGGYRSIDFALSSMANSHINKVAVFTQYNSKSLSQHLNSSKWWDFGRKQGGLYVFTPTQTQENNYWYRGTADAIAQNIDFLKTSHEPYVVIASGDCVYKLDYNDVLRYHIDKNADITIVTKELGEEEDPSRFGVVSIDDNGLVTEFEEKPIVTSKNIVSTGIYIIRRRQLIEMIERAGSEGGFDLVKDIFIRYRGLKKMYAYPMKAYWSNITTISSYFKTNMDFLNRDIRDYFFNQYPVVNSKIEDLPPAKYNVGSSVTNSLVSSGCIINGEVRNSILFKEVYVGNNCTIKNSLILNDVYIGDNTYIENCIVESHDTIRENSSYIGDPESVRVVLEKNARYVL
ncbi:MAG: glucose-1-phosphate adenylyltransferase subunit GlgD [Eubacterium sp.]|nr:glucose-1-phosphate adenylyltransferase subunit GlgD [Eubacterium sp.]